MAVEWKAVEGYDGDPTERHGAGETTEWERVRSRVRYPKLAARDSRHLR
jgi:hypothetical protein